MGVNMKANMKSPNFLLKIVALVLIIIVLGLGRGVPLELGTFDRTWLYHGTVVGAAITWIIMIVAYLLGDNLALRVEALFVMIYSIMFIATGAVTIQTYDNGVLRRDEGLAKGSIEVITGIVMFVDLLLLVKAILKK